MYDFVVAFSETSWFLFFHGVPDDREFRFEKNSNIKSVKTIRDTKCCSSRIEKHRWLMWH